MHKSVILLVPFLLCSCSRSGTSRAESKSGAGPGPKFTPYSAGPVDRWPVRINGKYGFIERDGKLVLKPEYAGATRFSEGLAAVQLKTAGRVGFIDESGKVVIPPQFELAEPFAEGLSGVMKDHKWGYIDTTGKWIIPAKFASGRSF